MSAGTDGGRVATREAAASKANSRRSNAGERKKAITISKRKVYTQTMKGAAVAGGGVREDGGGSRINEEKGLFREAPAG